MKKKFYIPYPNKNNPTETILWNDELPNIELADDCLKTVVNTNYVGTAKSKKYAIEINRPPFHASCYGLLGLEYIVKSTSNCVEIMVNYITQNTKQYNKTISCSKGTVFAGLLKEYANLVLTRTKKYITEENCIPPGILNFKVAANCEVGSSPMMFKWLTEILLRMISKNISDTSEDELTELLVATFKNKDF